VEGIIDVSSKIGLYFEEQNKLEDRIKLVNCYVKL
jgi:hypothetical protein